MGEDWGDGDGWRGFWTTLTLALSLRERGLASLPLWIPVFAGMRAFNHLYSNSGGYAECYPVREGHCGKAKDASVSRGYACKRDLIAKVLDLVKCGGDRGARTPNLGIANAALSQLSYIPTLPRALIIA